MSVTAPPLPQTQDLKMARRLSRRQGLFAPDLLRTALKQSFVMLRPDIQWKNPVMFVVEVGTVLSIFYTIAKAINPGAYKADLLYLVALDVWLFLTVLFANFASALAEARGKAQAETLRKTRYDTPAHLLSGNALEEVSSTSLRPGDRVVVTAGQIIPSDGEIVEGIASVDESAITGESAPVSRESGGDRSGVTGGGPVVLG